MASTIRSSSRFCAAGISRHAQAQLYRRAFHVSAGKFAAQNFLMPAMSPTMTEGNIASWKIKEGDSFSAGDVLLEIETDKAQMDVEAQEDGVMAKIMQQDGSKAVKVGSRIAVLAEQGDDIASLELPAEEPSGKPSSAQEDTSSPQSSSSERLKRSDTEDNSDNAPQPSPPKNDASAQRSAQAYPPYPSVQHLLSVNNISAKEAEKIPPSGPKGRLLKGDVLAYIGAIEKSYSSQQSSRISKLGHLDLSDIQKIAPCDKPATKPSPAKQDQTLGATEEIESDTQIAVPISLSAVLTTQKRIQESLGLVLPLSTFIARASEIANEDLPRKKMPASADELFDAVLGLNKVEKSSRGRFVPEVTALGPAPRATTPKFKSRQRSDIIDLLSVDTGHDSRSRLSMPLPAAVGAGSGSRNVFSVTVKKGDERRARVYLERVKSVLEREPGRCVL